MAFHEVRLPVRLAFGSTGGVERRTEVVTLGSGFERRSTPWAQGRRRYLIGANLRSLDDMAALTAFFEARRGRLYGFRFRDFADFKSSAPGGEITAQDQSLGVGDGVRTNFDLGKQYGEGEEAAVRRILKPVDGTVRIGVDGVELGAGDFAIDLMTGTVTFQSPPPDGAAVTAGFEFDVPVRFDADRIDVTLESFAAGRMAAVPLIEVRV
ncbi:DUF2460 domain-containing protein [Roseibacterium beibuensis]|uniref:DUF2460 domain-containing protein n=1 Tax=[Roseibacterium] beibuensis TaxID=1193142 RepID=UPI00217EE093|nr:DUF2460 domain-containing protein [Roseibacterium beibuensis]MCS6622771.1 DUF2460 domain-containing protein [Roseibacterium beibuensis]